MAYGGEGHLLAWKQHWNLKRRPVTPIFAVNHGCVCGGGGALSRVQLFETPWTVARQTPLSMGFSRQECWSGLLFHPPGGRLNPGIKSASPALAGRLLTSEPPEKPL